MMENREIKFRGLHEATGVWIEGDLYHGLNEGVYINHVIPTGENSRENKLTKVKKGTESQFTGLKDKNGVEIYEGDICIVNDNFKIYWRWDNLHAGFWPRKIPVGDYSFNNIYTSSNCEIIGNIHENPELL